MAVPSKRHQQALVATLIAALVLLVLAGSRYANTVELIDDSLPLRAFGSRTVHRLLSSVGALHLTPNPDETWELPQIRRRGLRPGEPASVCEDQRYAAGRLSRERLPSTAMADTDTVAQGIPLVSIAVGSCHLRRLFEQPRKRGRAWEVPAYMT